MNTSRSLFFHELCKGTLGLFDATFVHKIRRVHHVAFRALDICFDLFLLCFVAVAVGAQGLQVAFVVASAEKECADVVYFVRGRQQLFARVAHVVLAVRHAFFEPGTHAPTCALTMHDALAMTLFQNKSIPKGLNARARCLPLQ